MKYHGDDNVMPFGFNLQEPIDFNNYFMVLYIDIGYENLNGQRDFHGVNTKTLIFIPISYNYAPQGNT
jgi:hypothetical protein